MRSVIIVGLALFWQGTVLAQNSVDLSGLEALSPCVMQCSVQTLLRYDCSPEQSCFCDNSQLQTDIQACLTSLGCSFADQLEAKKLQTSTCNVPVRDRGTLLTAVAYTLFGIAAVFTIFRCLSRWSKLDGAGFSWDDLVAVICLAPLTVMTAGDYFAIHYGKGRDIWGLTATDVEHFSMWFYIFNNMYTFVVFGTKISLVLLYLRIWHARDTFRNLCWLILVLLTSALVAFQVVAIVQCIPIASQWRRFVDPNTQGSCIDRQAWAWALAGAEIGFNVLVILLPIRKLLKMKVSWPKRLGIFSVFLVGLAVTAMSIVRAFYTHGFTTNQNFTYYYSYIGLYSSIEAYLSQVCCCMPATASLVRRCWHKTTSKPPTGSKRSSRELNNTPFRSASREPTIDSAAIFNGVTPTQDPEKSHIDTTDPDPVKASDEYTSSAHESADSPIVQRTSHNSRHQPEQAQQRSFEATRRSFRTTQTTSTCQRTPDILYHDHQNQVRLEIHDPPREPVKATLTYLDRFDGKHDVELQGRPQTSPSSSRSSSTSSTEENIPFVGRKNMMNNMNNTLKPQTSTTRIEKLLQAHKALTEGAKVEDVRNSFGVGSGSKTSSSWRFSEPVGGDV
ncbi:hypothetical protein AC578_9631 [Pseudocercospora eumusae]|uniref:Uncharacterized protein n=1 Tax=Pseudocercospora eumusae TaxID=321146 RepID=A0A139H1B0_9PEZI|nr:hypothetical protein AC578_9631 [Pseudocercospora eumusae]